MSAWSTTAAFVLNNYCGVIGEKGFNACIDMDDLLR